MSNRKFTPSDDRLIRESALNNSDNLQRGFRELSLILNYSQTSISNRYYKYLRPTTIKSIEQVIQVIPPPPHISIWRRLFNFLFK